MAQNQVQKVSWWHERLADWMIMHPEKRLLDAAKFFDCSQSWLSVIKNSDSFKEYWVRRSCEASDANDSTTLLAKTAGLADMALDRLMEKMEEPSEILAAPFLLDVADTALKRLGYGSKPTGTAGGGQTNVNVTVGIVSPQQLEAAREKMKQLHGVVTATPNILEGEVLPPSKAVRNVG